MMSSVYCKACFMPPNTVNAFILAKCKLSMLHPHMHKYIFPPIAACGCGPSPHSSLVVWGCQYIFHCRRKWSLQAVFSYLQFKLWHGKIPVAIRMWNTSSLLLWSVKIMTSVSETLSPLHCIHFKAFFPTQNSFPHSF